jgi:hypothetical protein
MKKQRIKHKTNWSLRMYPLAKFIEIAKEKAKKT